MKTRWLRISSLVAVLALASLSANAQRRGSNGDPPSPNCECSAGGADCLFGNVDGCEVTCYYGNCECESASCLLGFPRRARCRCTGGIEV